MAGQPSNTIQLTSREVGQAAVVFLEQYLNRGGNDRDLLCSDIEVLLNAEGLAQTGDPASWGDWLQAVWGLRHISVRSRISTQSKVEVKFATGTDGTAIVRAIRPSEFEFSSSIDELGNSSTSEAVFSESTAYGLLQSFVEWSGFSDDSTIDSLIQNLRAIQDGKANPALESTWGQLLN